MRNVLLCCGLGSLFMGWNAPNHYPPWAAFHLELFAAAGAAFICLAVFSEAWPRQLQRPADGTALSSALTRLPMPRSARMWLLLSLWPVLQYLAGGLVFRGDALIGLLYGTGVVLSLYAGSLWAAQQGSERAVRWLFLTLVLGGLAANGLALRQWFRLENPGWWAMELIDDRPFANFAQPNHFGLLMVMAIVAVTALFEMTAVRHRWVHGLAVTIFGWGVLMSQSRASMLALVAVGGCWVLTRHRVPTRLRLVDALIAAAIWLLLSLAIEPLQALVLFKSAAARAPLEVGPRNWIWLHFWAAIVERPWLGYGFNQGVLALTEVAKQVHTSRNTIYAHNLVLDLMTWAGIPLALAATAALGWWMLSWLRTCQDSALMAQRHLVFAIWLALLIQSMLEFPYAHSYFLLPAALLAGAITQVPTSTVASHESRRYGASHWVMVLAASAIGLLGVVSWEYFRIEEDFRANRFERANFANRPEHESLTRPWVLDQLGALNESAHYDIAPGMSPERIEQLHVLARRFHMLSTRFDYAKALALNGRLEQAQEEMQIIRSVYHPALYAQIEKDWSEWKRLHAAELSPR